MDEPMPSSPLISPVTTVPWPIGSVGMSGKLVTADFLLKLLLRIAGSNLSSKPLSHNADFCQPRDAFCG